MSITITLRDDPLVEQLRTRAMRQHLQVEELVCAMLKDALTPVSHDLLRPEDVVADIRATPPNLRQIRVATGSLCDALRQAPDEADFDLDAWEQSWTTVEREMKAVTRANTRAEGRA